LKINLNEINTECIFTILIKFLSDFTKMDYKNYTLWIEQLPLTLQMNSTQAHSYKLEKEAFVTGFKGSSIEDVFLVCFMIPVYF